MTIQCGFNIIIKNEDAFIKKVADYMEISPANITSDDIWTYLTDNVFDEYAMKIPHKDDSLEIEGVDCDGRFLQSVEDCELISYIDRLPDEPEQER